MVIAGTETQDSYIFYPKYGLYFGVFGHQYHFQDHHGWAARPVQEGFSVDLLKSSSSVPMEFHDAPSHHHDAVVQQYPQTWLPVPAHEATNGRAGDQRDERR